MQKIQKHAIIVNDKKYKKQGGIMGKNKTKKSIIIQTVIVFSLCVILLVLLAVQFAKIWELRNSQNDINNKIPQITEENKKYSDELDYYNSSDYIEDQAHAKNRYYNN